MAEDAMTILDEFVHDVANLPAEIAHLLEEIQAKDQIVSECRSTIHQRDMALQKHVKAQGAQVKHQREDAYTKEVLASFDKAQALQDEKTALSEKACFLLDRHVRRLDIKIRNLQQEGSMAEDSQLPSLLHPSPANLVEPASANRSGVSTPLHSFGLGPTMTTSNPNVANAAVARLAHAQASTQLARGAPQAPMAGMQPHPLLTVGSAGPRVRESSAGAMDLKRRRPISTLGTMPIPSSNLARGASMGPGTPKAATPGSRAGSLGPRSKKNPIIKKPPGEHPLRKRLNKGALSRKAARRLKNGNRGSPSTTGEDNSDGSGSDDDNVSQSQQNEGAEDDEMADGGYEEDGDDNELYCICRNPSHGNMIACDNAKCKFEWFHYECVGLKEEPKGKWLCPECRKLPSKEIKIPKPQ